MEIQSIILTDAEMNEAIQKFLEWRNIQVEVAGVSGKGYPRKGWEVDLKTRDVPVLPQAAEPAAAE